VDISIVATIGFTVAAALGIAVIALGAKKKR
jgi:hypothetical protein